MEISWREPVAGEEAARHLFGLAHGELEHRLPVLLHEVQALVDGLVRWRTEAAAGGHRERPAAGAVDLMLEVEDAVLLPIGRRDDHRPCAVPKEDTGCAVGVVDDARHHVGPDHERVLVRAARHHLASRRQRISEGGTGRAQIESPGPMGANLRLQQAGGARKHHVRGDRSHDNHIDVVGRQPGALNGGDGRLLPEVGGCHTGIDGMALSDARALKDPLVAGADHLLEVLIRQDAGRHVRCQ